MPLLLDKNLVLKIALTSGYNIRFTGVPYAFNLDPYRPLAGLNGVSRTPTLLLKLSPRSIATPLFANMRLYLLSSGRVGVAGCGTSTGGQWDTARRRWLRRHEQDVFDRHRDHVHQQRAVRELQARPAAPLLVTAVEQVPAPRLHQHPTRLRQNGDTSHVGRRQAFCVAVRRRKSRVVQQRISRNTRRCSSWQSTFRYFYHHVAK